MKVQQRRENDRASPFLECRLSRLPVVHCISNTSFRHCMVITQPTFHIQITQERCYTKRLKVYM